MYRRGKYCSYGERNCLYYENGYCKFGSWCPKQWFEGQL